MVKLGDKGNAAAEELLKPEAKFWERLTEQCGEVNKLRGKESRATRKYNHRLQILDASPERSFWNQLKEDWGKENALGFFKKSEDPDEDNSGENAGQPKSAKPMKQTNEASIRSELRKIALQNLIKGATQFEQMK